MPPHGSARYADVEAFGSWGWGTYAYADPEDDLYMFDVKLVLETLISDGPHFTPRLMAKRSSLGGQLQRRPCGEYAGEARHRVGTTKHAQHCSEVALRNHLYLDDRNDSCYVSIA